MSGSTNLPPPASQFLDSQGKVSLIWRRFFAAILTRTGGSGATANALLNGDSTQRFAVATAQKNSDAVPYAQYLSNPGQNFVSLHVGNSPWSYSAPSNGSLALGGGTITDLEIQRNGVQANIGAAAGLYTMRQNDVIVVRYSSKPTGIWMPN